MLGLELGARPGRRGGPLWVRRVSLTWAWEVRPRLWGLVGCWVGEKGSSRPTLSGSPFWDFWNGRKARSPGLAPMQRRGGRGGLGGHPRMGVEDRVAGIYLSVEGEPYPSSINSCALPVTHASQLSSPLSPISQSDKLRLAKRLW